VALPASNLSASAAYYDALFARVHRPWLGVAGVWFALGDGAGAGELHLIQGRARSGPAGERAAAPGTHGVHASIPVNSTRDWATRLHALGIPLTHARQRSDNVRRLFFADPDGHSWELTGPLEPPVAHGYAGSPPRLPHRISEPAVAAGHDGAVASGNPYATAAAHSILLAGGTAAEAAIAAAAVLGVVEPYNGGLGGDLFALVAAPYDAGVPSSPRKAEASQRGKSVRPLRVTTLNGSGRAPTGVAPSLSALREQLAREDHRPAAERAAHPIPKRGPLSTLTVPGATGALCELYVHHGGAVPWELLLQPAIDLALNGFVLSEHTATAWRQGVSEVMGEGRLGARAEADFRAIWLADDPPSAGDTFVNVELARSLALLARGGCDAFHDEDGPISHALRYASVNGSPLQLPASGLRRGDWAATWEIPEQTEVRSPRGGGRCTVFGPRGNSQAAATLDILDVLSELHVRPTREPGRYLHALLSAKRLVYSRKRTALGDGSVRSPSAIARQAGIRTKPALLPSLSGERRRVGATLAAEVRKLFESGWAASAIGTEGENATAHEQSPAPSPDTVAVAVADRTGQLVTLSQSLGPMFGSGLCDPAVGFCLQSRGYGFAIGAAAEAAGHANLYALGRRPFHTLSPLLLHCGAWQLALACKGGDRVPYAAAHFLWNLLDSTPALAAEVVSHSEAVTGNGAVKPPTPSQLAKVLATPRVRDAVGPQPFAPAAHGSLSNPSVEAEPGVLGMEAAVGYTFVPPSSSHFEDSGFAVLHAVVRVAPFDSMLSAGTVPARVVTR